MATEICKLLQNAIRSEIEAQQEYKKVEANIDKTDKWKIREIKSEENIHEQELKVISKRLKCDV